MIEAEATPARGTLDPKLPLSPDVGFFGRDETLLAIDRAFDTQSIVLLHAYAGNGKTSTAAEFAHWYSLTGGVDGPVLFTSFAALPERCRRLIALLFYDKEELSYSDIARIIKAPVNSIGPTRARCLEKLKKILENFF